MGHITDIGLSEGYTVKKRFATFPSPVGMSLTKLTLGRNNYSRKGRVSDIPSADGNVANLYFMVYTYT
jgi:hypothetical protein